MKTFISFILFLYSFSIFSSEAIGYYSNGSLKNSQNIEDYSDHPLMKLFKKRGQLYGTAETMAAITGLANFMKNKYPTIEKTQIGDIAARNGGNIYRHKSHQNGLDSDLVYYRVDEKTQNPKNPEWEEYFVINRKLTKNFHVERNWEAMKYLVNNHDVGRIFVDGQIKKALCRYARKVGEFEAEQETLRRLRIENKVHMHHFHLRLKCPSGNPRCTSQGEPPRGSGC